MSLGRRAQRKLIEWLNFCREIGWEKSQMSGLADLWLKYHDEETGELLP